MPVNGGVVHSRRSLPLPEHANPAAMLRAVVRDNFERPGDCIVMDANGNPIKRLDPITRQEKPL